MKFRKDLKNENNKEIFSLVLNSNANPNARDHLFNSPLHYVPKEEKDAIINLLCFRADPNIQNSDGISPIDLFKNKSYIYSIFEGKNKWTPYLHQYANYLLPTSFPNQVFQFVCSLDVWSRMVHIKVPKQIIYILINFLLKSPPKLKI